MAKSPFETFKSQPPRPPQVAIDRFGKVIEPGHLVLFRNTEDLVFEVLGVQPVLNPSVPQGAIQITLAAQFPVQSVAALPTRYLVIVGETPARQATVAATNGTGEHADELRLKLDTSKDLPPTVDPDSDPEQD